MTLPDGLRAHWIQPNLIALPASWGDDPVLEERRARGRAATEEPAPSGYPLARAAERDGELPTPLRRAGLQAWTVEVDGDPREAIRARLTVTTRDGQETGVQLAKLLDALFAGAVDSEPLGASINPDGTVVLRLWAPTAIDVSVEVLEVVDPASGAVDVVHSQRATRDAATGVWTVPADATEAPEGSHPIRVGTAYRWLVSVYAPSTDRVEHNRVTDPYSHALTTNATASVVVDLTDPALASQQWATTPSPRLPHQVDHLITELHVRDLSREATELPAAERGTYRAFTRDIPGTRHLRALADAGVTTVHLLPVYDIATVEEDRSRWVAADAVADPAVLDSLPRDSAEQQRLVGEANAVARSFNWGYDPLHVFAPEGSYAVDPHGAARCGEVREMVGALHAAGLAVVVDQVFNHTHACGQDPTSVLCRIVPGYYSRLAVDGTVETSTCCPNVATECAMAQRWMVDAVVHWARAYRVDGFRFDLMGHHSRENMLAVRAGLDALTLEHDGVDGAGVLLYGEGWNFGEVADDALFTQARQGNLGGTAIATFSDRLRDAVVGGTPSERGTLRTPGAVTGLAWGVGLGDDRVGNDDGAGPVGTEPSGSAVGTVGVTDPNHRGQRTEPSGSAKSAKSVESAGSAEFAAAATLLRLGLAGNLRSVVVPTAAGPRRGDEIGYGGQTAGYADEPDEVVTYIDAHDNETWYDLAVLKLPREATPAERVKVNTLGLAAVAWSQTIGFWHAGAELLRSKSLDHDSYDSGDWFNRIDWTGQRSTFGRGLPPAWRNEAEWPLLAPLLADPRLRPGPEAIAQARESALAVARVRRGVPLLRLGSAAAVRELVTFPGAPGEPGAPDAETGLIAVLVDTSAAAPEVAATAAARDPQHRAALVLLNTGRRTQRLAVPALRGRHLVPAPGSAGSPGLADGVTWFLAPGVVEVPGLAAAVLVEPR